MPEAVSYFHRPSTTPMEGRKFFELLDEQAAKFPNKEAFIFRDEKGNRKSLIFKEYQEQSQALATSLLELGLARGDKALVMLPSSIEFVVVQMALNRIGVVAIIIEPYTVEAVTSVSIERSVEVRCVFCTDLYDDVTSAVNEVCLDPNFKAAVIVGSTSSGNSKAHSYEVLVQRTEDNSAALAKAEKEVQFDDPFYVTFTSGSTGIPKPVEYTYHAFVQGTTSHAYAIGASCDTILFCDAPFDWITGMINLSIVPVLGITYVAFPPHLAVEGQVTRQILQIFEEEEVNLALCLSYFMVDMTQLEGIHEINLSKLKVIYTGGQLTDRLLIKKVISMLPDVTVMIIYGATEFLTPGRQIVTAANVDTTDYSSYEITPGWELMVVDSKGKIVPVETQGELFVRGAGLYLNVDSLVIKGKRHKTPKTPTGWHPSNDSAAITSDGKLRIFGRVDNVIKCATESVQPAEVESVLSEHENVVSVIAVGVPDQRLYEVVCACVVLKSYPHGNQQEAIAELDEWCSDMFHVTSIGLSAHPKHYVVLESFPKTRTGKTDRKALKVIAKERLGF